MAKNLTYKDAGVDIDAGEALVNDLKKVNPSIGGFGGFLDIPKGYRNPRLVLSTDGVGTKLLVAQAMEKFDTIGIDLVGMVVNDIITTGARPIAFLDYYATAKLEKQKSRDILKGIIEGCKLAGCELNGGETAEMPGVYPKGGYDLAGFGVGVVEKGEEIDGTKTRPGDVVIGLASSGLHSNGYSLARKILTDKRRVSCPKERQELLEWMLIPTIIYVKPILKLINKVPVKGIANITGGGIPGNLVRALPKGTKAVLDLRGGQMPEVFERLYVHGNMKEEEMFRVFNMGVGMCVVVSPKDVHKAVTLLQRQKIDCLEIGTIEKGKRGVDLQTGSGLFRYLA